MKKDEPKQPGRSLDQRQRKDAPTPTDSPVVSPPAISAAAPAPAKRPRAEALTPGQERFLASLDADQRARVNALNPGKRAALLAPHAAGFVADIFDFQLAASCE